MLAHTDSKHTGESFSSVEVRLVYTKIRFLGTHSSSPGITWTDGPIELFSLTAQMDSNGLKRAQFFPPGVTNGGDDEAASASVVVV